LTQQACGATDFVARNEKITFSDIHRVYRNKVSIGGWFTKTCETEIVLIDNRRIDGTYHVTIHLCSGDFEHWHRALGGLEPYLHYKLQMMLRDVNFFETIIKDDTPVMSDLPVSKLIHKLSPFESPDLSVVPIELTETRHISTRYEADYVRDRVQRIVETETKEKEIKVSEVKVGEEEEKVSHFKIVSEGRLTKVVAINPNDHVDPDTPIIVLKGTNKEIDDMVLAETENLVDELTLEYQPGRHLLYQKVQKGDVLTSHFIFDDNGLHVMFDHALVEQNGSSYHPVTVVLPEDGYCATRMKMFIDTQNPVYMFCPPGKDWVQYAYTLRDITKWFVPEHLDLYVDLRRDHKQNVVGHLSVNFYSKTIPTPEKALKYVMNVFGRVVSTKPKNKEIVVDYGSVCKGVKPKNIRIGSHIKGKKVASGAINKYKSPAEKKATRDTVVYEPKKTKPVALNLHVEIRKDDLETYVVELKEEKFSGRKSCILIGSSRKGNKCVRDAFVRFKATESLDVLKLLDTDSQGVIDNLLVIPPDISKGSVNLVRAKDFFAGRFVKTCVLHKSSEDESFPYITTDSLDSDVFIVDHDDYYHCFGWAPASASNRDSKKNDPVWGIHNFRPSPKVIEQIFNAGFDLSGEDLFSPDSEEELSIEEKKPQTGKNKDKDNIIEEVKKDSAENTKDKINGGDEKGEKAVPQRTKLDPKELNRLKAAIKEGKATAKETKSGFVQNVKPGAISAGGSISIFQGLVPDNRTIKYEQTLFDNGYRQYDAGTQFEIIKGHINNVDLTLDFGLAKRYVAERFPLEMKYLEENKLLPKKTYAHGYLRFVTNLFVSIALSLVSTDEVTDIGSKYHQIQMLCKLTKRNLKLWAFRPDISAKDVLYKKVQKPGKDTIIVDAPVGVDSEVRPNDILALDCIWYDGVVDYIVLSCTTYKDIICHVVFQAYEDTKGENVHYFGSNGYFVCNDGYVESCVDGNSSPYSHKNFTWPLEKSAEWTVNGVTFFEEDTMWTSNSSRTVRLRATWTGKEDGWIYGGDTIKIDQEVAASLIKTIIMQSTPIDKEDQASVMRAVSTSYYQMMKEPCSVFLKREQKLFDVVVKELLVSKNQRTQLAVKNSSSIFDKAWVLINKYAIPYGVAMAVAAVWLLDPTFIKVFLIDGVIDATLNTIISLPVVPTFVKIIALSFQKLVPILGQSSVMFIKFIRVAVMGFAGYQLYESHGELGRFAFNMLTNLCKGLKFTGITPMVEFSEWIQTSVRDHYFIEYKPVGGAGMFCAIVGVLSLALFSFYSYARAKILNFFKDIEETVLGPNPRIIGERDIAQIEMLDYTCTPVMQPDSTIKQDKSGVSVEPSEIMDDLDVAEVLDNDEHDFHHPHASAFRRRCAQLFDREPPINTLLHERAQGNVIKSLNGIGGDLKCEPFIEHNQYVHEPDVRDQDLTPQGDQQQATLCRPKLVGGQNIEHVVIKDFFVDYNASICKVLSVDNEEYERSRIVDEQRVKPIYRHAGLDLDFRGKVHTKKPDTLASVKSAFARQFNSFETPDPVVVGVFKDFARKSVTEMVNLLDPEPLSTGQFLAKVPENKLSIYKLGLELHRDGWFESPWISIFPKSEICHGEPDQRPRCISNPCPSLKFISTMYNTWILDDMKKFDWFHIGYNADETKTIIEAKRKNYEDPVIVSYDGSSHDSHQWAELQECCDNELVIQTFDKFYDNSDLEPTMKQASFERLCATTHRMRIPSKHNRFKNIMTMLVHHGVFSGLAHRTTLGNTLRVYLYAKFITHLSGINADILVAGDDSIIIMERKDFISFEFWFWQIYSLPTVMNHGLGQVCKSLNCSDTAADFLSKNIFVMPDSSIAYNRKPRRALYGSQHTKTDQLSDATYIDVITYLLSLWGDTDPFGRLLLRLRETLFGQPNITKKASKYLEVKKYKLANHQNSSACAYECYVELLQREQDPSIYAELDEISY